MSLEAWLLAKVADKVFGYASDKGENLIQKGLRDKLGLEPRKQAYKHALEKAYKQFEKKYPEWAANLFNVSFLENEGANVLAQFLIQDGRPNPSELATLWADSLSLRKPERRITLVRELEPAAADFLDYMTSALKGEEALSDLNDSRALDLIVSELKALRKKFETEQATPGTCRDYLHWLIERNLYLDPRGTFQTQRQVQVKLDAVYISLRAQHEVTPSPVDHKLLEQEMAQLEAKIVSSKLSAEEIEDQHEHLTARLIDIKNVPGEILELAEVVKHHDHVVMLGDPGGGKSTLLRYLALKHAQALWEGRTDTDSGLGIARFPILIRIADYAEYGMPQGKSLSDFLIDYHNLHECPKSGLADLLTGELAAGNCLVLLDGLDEIVSADDRRKVVERIENFVRYHENCPNHFVITSRRAGYRSAPLGDSFVHYVVQNMDDAQIRHFLEHWCTAIEAAQTPDLSKEARHAVGRREIDAIMKAVQNSPGVRRLAVNPLLLRTLALIHRTGAQLPQKRIELYKLAADTLAHTWRTAQGVPESALVDESYLTRLLSKLACWLHTNKPTGIATEKEICDELGKEWARIKGLSWEEDSPEIGKEVKKFLRQVREHTGLLVELSPRRYGFMHLTFEEYYVARYLVARSRTRAQLIRERLHKSRWEEPTLLALGFVGLDSPEDAAELVETAILAQSEEAQELSFTPSKYEDLLGRDYLFALRCLGDQIPVRTEVMQKLVERLADELLYRTGSARFQSYQKALEERISYLNGSKAAAMLIPHLLAALNSSDPSVYIEAVRYLKKLGHVAPEAVTTLINILSNSPIEARKAVIKLFENLDQFSPEILTALVANLGNSNFSIREASISSLSRVGQSHPEVVTAILNVLCSDNSYMARFAAARCLGQLGQASPEIVLALLESLRNDKHAVVRGEAALSLGLLPTESNEIENAILNALHDNDPAVRRGAVLGLEFLERRRKSDKGATTLLNILHGEDDEVRSYVAATLDLLDQTSSEILTALIEALHDPNTEMRANAAASLGKLQQKSPEIMEALLESLHSEPDSEVRFIAATSLGNLGHVSPELVSVLLNALQSAKKWTIQCNSALLLGRIGQSDKQTIQALCRGLLNKFDDARTACATALAQLGRRFPDTQVAIEKVLLQAIEDPEFDKAAHSDQRSAHDYAFDGLWSLMVGREIGESLW